MTKLIITIGCPGAGKSTWADRNLPSTTLRLERDRFREAMWGSRQAYHDDPLAPAVKSMVIGSAMFNAARYWPEDRDIALTDTNIHWSAVKRFAGLRRQPELLVFYRPLDLLLERNRTRPVEHRVPETVLRQFHTDMADHNAWWRKYPHMKIGEAE